LRKLWKTNQLRQQPQAKAESPSLFESTIDKDIDVRMEGENQAEANFEEDFFADSSYSLSVTRSMADFLPSLNHRAKKREEAPSKRRNLNLSLSHSQKEMKDFKKLQERMSWLSSC